MKKKSSVENTNREAVIAGIESFISYLEDKWQISREDLKAFIEKKPEGPQIPVSAFSNGELTALETVCKYLYENIDFTFSQIGRLLSRNPRMIAATYHRANSKFPRKFGLKASPFYIPPSLFENRRLSALENLVVFLKEKHELTFHKIALLLHRDDSTIWTVYSRAKKKYETQLR